MVGVIGLIMTKKPLDWRLTDSQTLILLFLQLAHADELLPQKTIPSKPTID
jgi:hypothetical protein